MKTSISNEYFVMSANYKEVYFVINYDDERDFDITFNCTVSASAPVKFLCLDCSTIKETNPNIDFFVSNDILMSNDYLNVLRTTTMYKCSLLPATINNKSYLYLHCGNVIDIFDGNDFDFNRLENIPAMKRLLFKPSKDSMTYLFHVDLLNLILSIGEIKYTKFISVNDWSFDWMLS